MDFFYTGRPLWSILRCNINTSVSLSHFTLNYRTLRYIVYNNNSVTKRDPHFIRDVISDHYIIYLSSTNQRINVLLQVQHLCAGLERNGWFQGNKNEENEYLHCLMAQWPHPAFHLCWAHINSLSFLRGLLACSQTHCKSSNKHQTEKKCMD